MAWTSGPIEAAYRSVSDCIVRFVSLSIQSRKRFALGFLGLLVRATTVISGGFFRPERYSRTVLGFVLLRYHPDQRRPSAHSAKSPSPPCSFSTLGKVLVSRGERKLVLQFLCQGANWNLDFHASVPLSGRECRQIPSNPSFYVAQILRKRLGESG